MSKPRFTARRINAALNAISAMLAGIPNEGDWAPEVTPDDLRGAAAAIRAMHPGVPPAAPTRWAYHSATIGGNFHDAAAMITKTHPEWDVVAMDVVGNYTIVVWREELS